MRGEKLGLGGVWFGCRVLEWRAGVAPNLGTALENGDSSPWEQHLVWEFSG